MKVIQFALDVNYVNVFLAFDEISKNAFLVDCGAFHSRIQETIHTHALNLEFLLITHTHYDHIDGVSNFRKAFDVPIYAFAKNYEEQVQDADRIPFGEKEIIVFETPGHISDGVSYFIDRAVFVGDAIFSGAVGGTTDRQHFEEEITQVRCKILTLPNDTVIYPGHGAPSLVGIERIYNPFFN